MYLHSAVACSSSGTPSKEGGTTTTATNLDL
jgi:hypothetical protein